MGLSTQYQYIISLQDKLSGPMRSAGLTTSTSYRNMQKNQENFKNSMIGFGNSVRKYLAIGALVSFAEKSIEAFNESAVALASVQAGIKSTHNAAGKSLGDLEAQAKKFQKNTFFEDDDIMQNATNQILTFSNITGAQFDRTQQAALDLSAKLFGVNAGGENLKGTSIQLGKALNDPNRGLAMLSKSGVTFSTIQQKMIKDMWNSGKQAKAQNLILAEVERQYGGTAAAMAKTPWGQQKQQLNLIGDQMERIGQILIPIKTQLLGFFQIGLKHAVDFYIKWQGLIKIVLKAAIAFFVISKTFKAMRMVYAFLNSLSLIYYLLVKNTTRALVKYNRELGAAGISALGYSGAMGIASLATRALVQSIKAVGIAIYNIPIIGWIAAAIALLVALFKILWDRSEGFRAAMYGIWNVVKTYFGYLMAYYKIIWDIIKGAISGIVGAIKWGWGLLKKLVDWFYNNVVLPIKNAFSGMWEHIGDILTKIGSLFKKAFEPIIWLWNKIFKNNKIVADFKTSWHEGTKKGHEAFQADRQAKKNGGIESLFTGGGGGGLPPEGDLTNDITGGGSKPTNITINLGKLNEKIEIHTNNLKEGAQDIERIFNELFLRVLNSSAKLQTQ